MIHFTDHLKSVVFVHGLGGHRQKTWTRKRVPHPSNTPSLLDRWLPSRKRKAITLDDELNIQISDQAERGDADVYADVFWPKDILPKDLPTCRICTWGYNVDLNLIRRDTSTATVFQHAKNLLSDIADARMLNAEKTRPYLGEIFPATKGICFLGTPHRGSSKAALAETLSRVTETWGNSPNVQILQALKYDAETLDREGLDYKGLIIVDRFSSRLDIQGEMPVDIEANHVEMTKFESSKDHGYIRVSKTILRWVIDLQERDIQASSTGNDIMEDCLQSLYNTKRGSRSSEVDEAFRGTLDWLFSDRVSFSTWLQDSGRNGSPIYWINGKPGSGKSTIMKYALNHKTTMHLLQLSSPGNWSTLSFFFHDRERQSKWPLEQLEKAFEIITTQSIIPLKACLFIDALDEHAGDHGRLLALIQRLEQKYATDTSLVLPSPLPPVHSSKFIITPSMTSRDIRKAASNHIQMRL
ncbi:hypothetical protein V8E51_005093 [Hyaloscypha variabilis]